MMVAQESQDIEATLALAIMLANIETLCKDKCNEFITDVSDYHKAEIQRFVKNFCKVIPAMSDDGKRVISFLETLH